MFEINTNLLLLIFGVAFIFAWGMGLFWNWRSWYWRSQRAIYGYLPIGFLFILANFEERLLASEVIDIWVLRAIYFLLLAVTVWWTVRTPALLKPWWAKEIEANKPAVYTRMKKTVKTDANWQKYFEDLDSLLSWIKIIENDLKKSKK